MRRLLRLACAALLGACSPAKTPAPATAAPEPVRATASAPSDASAPVVDAEPSEQAAGTAAPGPGCLTRELRAEGRVYAAELQSDGALDFCVKKGFLSDAPKACLRLHPAEKKFEATADLWPGFRFEDAGAEPDEPASAMDASSAGTRHVCADREHCTTLRWRAPARDAWDEVYGALPAVSVRGSSRVLLARLEETYPRPSGPAKLTVFVDAVDVKRGAKVASAVVAKNVSPIHLLWLGKKALLEACDFEGGPCAGFVIDPVSLAAKKLPIELDRPEHLGAGHLSALVLRAGPESWILVDAQGRAALWVDQAGNVVRRLELDASTDPSQGTPRAGFGRGRALWVLQAGPSAGRVSLIDLEAGSAVHFDAPACK